MRLIYPALIAACALLAFPATAQDKQQPTTDASAPDKPVTDKPVTAADVATTPLSDLNLRKQGIPAALSAAQARPYDRTGLGKCKEIAQAIAELDQSLGPDLDLPQTDGPKSTPGSVAKAAVASFIPFRGLIRELSGANAQDHKVQDAIEAGLARRGFLKGYGEGRGCKYPARSATPELVSHQTISTSKGSSQGKRGKSQFVSQPVTGDLDGKTSMR